MEYRLDGIGQVFRLASAALKGVSPCRYLLTLQVPVTKQYDNGLLYPVHSKGSSVEMRLEYLK